VAVPVIEHRTRLASRGLSHEFCHPHARGKNGGFQARTACCASAGLWIVAYAGGRQGCRLGPVSRPRGHQRHDGPLVRECPQFEHRLRVSLRWPGIDPAIQMLRLCGAGRGRLPHDASQSVEHQVARVEGILPSHVTSDLPLVAADGAGERPLPSLAEEQPPSALHAQPSGNTPHRGVAPDLPGGRTHLVQT
jgi:hypothetical protein